MKNIIRKIIIENIPPIKKPIDFLKDNDLYGEDKYIIKAYKMGGKNKNIKPNKLNPNTIILILYFL
tara:strand:- start:106 stop:303 length:198 start_codon:yes stop_codon:yes gene_type:complete